MPRVPAIILRPHSRGTDSGESHQPSREHSGVGQLGQLHVARDFPDAPPGGRRPGQEAKRCGAWPPSNSRSTGSTASSSPTNIPTISAAWPPLLAQWRTTVYLTAETHAETLRILPETPRQAARARRVHRGRASDFPWAISKSRPSAFPTTPSIPLGFTFRAGGVKVAVVTDLGYMPELVKHHLRDSDAMVLESNHDLEMLKVGPYPWHVKQRVMSRTGHLSNDTVSEFLADPEGFDARSALSGAGAPLRKQQQSRRRPHLRRRSARPPPRRLRLSRRIAGSLAARASAADPALSRFPDHRLR